MSIPPWQRHQKFILMSLELRRYFPKEEGMMPHNFGRYFLSYETNDPRVSFHHICLCNLFSFAFIFRSIKPKIQKYLAAIYLYRDLFILSTTFISHYLPILRRCTRKGLTTPLTRRVASICYLCAGAVYVVLLGSPTGSITLVSYLREILTLHLLHHPLLFGENQH